MTSHQKLKLEQVRSIRKEWEKMESLREEIGLQRLSLNELGRKYKISKRAVWAVVNYHSYTEVY